MNKELQKRKTEAMLTLSDELYTIKGDIEKAMALLQEVTTEYFQRYDSDKKDERAYILYDFDRAALYASVVEDYVYNAKNTINALIKINESEEE